MSVYDSADWLALVTTIRATPEDDTPRLVAADLLREQGEDARAELIAVQCEAAGLMAVGHGGDCPELARRMETARTRSGGQMTPQCPGCEQVQWLEYREAELLDAGMRLGWNDFPGWLTEWWWRRGMLDEVRLSAADWLAHGDHLYAREPVTAVRLTTWPTLSDVAWRAWKNLRDGRTPYVLLEATCLALFYEEWPDVAFTLPETPGRGRLVPGPYPYRPRG